MVSKRNERFATANFAHLRVLVFYFSYFHADYSDRHCITRLNVYPKLSSELEF